MCTLSFSGRFGRTCFSSSAVPLGKFKLSSGNISLALQSACVTWWTEGSPHNNQGCQGCCDPLHPRLELFLKGKRKNRSAPGLLLSAVKSVGGPVNCADIQWQCAKSTLHQDVTTDLAILMSRPVYSKCCFILNIYLFCTHVTLYCMSTVILLLQTVRRVGGCCNSEKCSGALSNFSTPSCRTLECFCHCDSFHEFRWSLERLVRWSKRDQKQWSVPYWHLSSVVKSRVDGWGMLRLHMAFMSPHASVLHSSALCNTMLGQRDRQTDEDFWLRILYNQFT